ncbi:succinyl-diaminopimelate desuccinylase [Magnetofaba australis]|nr:succinyl-diaminopimelate desuccinylase [Magnetofaba australis]
MNASPIAPAGSGDPLEIALELLRAPSITPEDHGAQDILIRHLEDLGFTIHHLRFGDIENFYARIGETGKNFCFAGHTDVVPPGDATKWRSQPFAADIVDGLLIGRGACDMKGGLAAMLAGAARFLTERPHFAQHNSLSFLITGDEEGDAVNGTIKILDWLNERGETLDYCVVGEPTSAAVLGDVVKNGRRGSVNGVITIRGMAGHVAYPHLAKNAIHLAAPAIAAISAIEFDQGNQYFQPSSLQFTRIEGGGAATNVVPGALEARFNIRFSTEHTPDSLEALIREKLADLDYDLTMTVSGLPFLTDGGELVESMCEVVRNTTGQQAELATGGGTSDARFISQVCPQTVEFGLVGQTMHKVDECVPIADLETLTEVYRRLLEKMFSS